MARPSAQVYARSRLTITVATLALLGACGGGGGGSSDPVLPPPTGPTAEGFYAGTLGGSSTASAFQLLVLENGEYWSIYGYQFSTIFSITGFVQGTGTSNNGTFTSSNAKDFGFVPAVPGTVNATYNASTPSVSGAAAFAAGTVTFNGGASLRTLYNYDTPASLAAVSGAWTLKSLPGESISLNVSTNGTFTARASGGCNFSGTASPRASGKNVFNVSLTFGPAPCALPGQAATGIAVAYQMASGANELVVAVVEPTRSYGFGAYGTR